MQQHPLFPSPAELNKMYWNLLEDPNTIKDLSAAHKNELRKYAESIERSSWDAAESRMLKYPNLDYPSEYRNGREMEYITEHMSTAQESRRVLRLLAEERVEATAPAPQPAETIPTAGAAEVKPKTTLPAAIPVDFSLYIKEEYREKLLPFLKQKYTGQKPRAVACMLLALHDLEALKNSPHNNKMQLHESLKAFFGKVGTRQALSTNLKDLEFAKGNEHLQIEAHRKLILDFMQHE